MKKGLRKTIRFVYQKRVVILALYALLITVIQIVSFATMNKTEAPEEVEVVAETTTEPQWEYFEASAYCKCRKCCGKWADNRPTDKYGDEIVYGAANIPLEEGVSIAADWDILPKGTVVEVEGYGVYTVEDTGSDIKGYKIDIFFDSHVIAEAFGRKTVAIKVLEQGGV